MVTKVYLLVIGMPRVISFSLGLVLGSVVAVAATYLLFARHAIVDQTHSKLERYFGPAFSVEFQQPSVELTDGTLAIEKITVRDRSSGRNIAQATDVVVRPSHTDVEEVVAAALVLDIPDRLSLRGTDVAISKISGDTIHLMLRSVSIDLPPPLDFTVPDASLAVVAAGGNGAEPMMVNVSVSQWAGTKLSPLFEMTSYSRLAPDAFLHPQDLFRGYLDQLDITLSKPGLHERLLWALVSGGRVDADTISFFASEREAALAALPLTVQSRDTIRSFYESQGSLALTLRPTVQFPMSSLFEELGSQSLIDHATLESTFTPTNRYSLR